MNRLNVAGVERSKSTGQIYFIEAVGSNRVKIGWARSVLSRLSSLVTASPYPLKVLLVLKEKVREDEAAYHEFFEEHRRHGEWFEIEGDLKRFIESHIAESGPWDKSKDNQEDWILTIRIKPREAAILRRWGAILFPYTKPNWNEVIRHVIERSEWATDEPGPENQTPK